MEFQGSPPSPNSIFKGAGIVNFSRGTLPTKKVGRRHYWGAQLKSMNPGP